MSRFWTAAFVILSLATDGRAQIIDLLIDEVDDRESVQRVREVEEVKALGKQMDVFRRRLYPLKERDFEALFGKPSTRAAKSFAMPVAQPRALMLSGLSSANPKENKDHTEFYTLGDFAGIEVSYHNDGVTPQVILFYLRVDKDFPKLKADNLAKRLAWERERLRRIPLLFEERRAKVFVWEVDPEAERKFFQQDYSSDPKTKLESWLATGKKLGYRLKVETLQEEGPRYFWYRPDGSLARKVSSRSKEKLPGEFIWYHEGSGREYRRESYSRGRISWWRWGRRDKNGNIRFETANANGRPVEWTWETGDGHVIRREWDENGDGIPDLFAQTRTGKVGRRLPLKESWAVHPELIPEGSRIPDQPERRVPLRKITRKVKEPTQGNDDESKSR